MNKDQTQTRPRSATSALSEVRKPTGDEVFYSSVSPKGQVTIPAHIRQMMGVRPKDRIAFRVVEGHVQLRQAVSPLDELYQSVPPLHPRRSWKEIEEIARDEQAVRVAKEGLE